MNFIKKNNLSIRSQVERGQQREACLFLALITTWRSASTFKHKKNSLLPILKKYYFHKIKEYFHFPSIFHSLFSHPTSSHRSKDVGIDVIVLINRNKYFGPFFFPFLLSQFTPTLKKINYIYGYVSIFIMWE